MEQKTCPYCNNPIQSNFIYCPTCGKNLMEATSPISLSRQVGVYALSFFLPPFGLVPGIKYMLGKQPNSARVGIIAITLTLLSVIISVALFMQILNSITSNVNSQLNQQLNLYNQL